jgi:hypothetical protein
MDSIDMTSVAQYMKLQRMDVRRVKSIVTPHNMPSMQSLDMSYSGIDIEQMLAVMPSLDSVYANSHATGLHTLGAHMFRYTRHHHD